MTETIAASTTGYATNPAELLERFYQQVTRPMAELPVFNNQLSVEAVGFREWEGHWLGIVITPWFMNLLVLPRAGSPWPDLQTGKAHRITLAFPYGNYSFEPRYEEGLGPYLCCSLMSPVHELPDQASARSLAEDVMSCLNRIPAQNLDEAANQDAGCTLATECATSQASAPGLTRRQLFGG